MPASIISYASGFNKILYCNYFTDTDKVFNICTFGHFLILILKDNKYVKYTRIPYHIFYKFVQIFGGSRELGSFSHNVG